jgi:hypothetical protein
VKRGNLRENLVTYIKSQDFAKKTFKKTPLLPMRKKKPYKVISLGFMNS